MPSPDPVNTQLFNELPIEVEFNIINLLQKKDSLKFFAFLYPEIIKGIFKDNTQNQLQQDLMECWLSEPHDALIKKKEIILENVQLKMQGDTLPFLERMQWLCLYNHLRGKKSAVPDSLIVALKKNLTCEINNATVADCQVIFSYIVPMLSQAQVDSFFVYLTQQLLLSHPIKDQASHALFYLSKRLSSAQLIAFAKLLEEVFCPWLNHPWIMGSYYDAYSSDLIQLLNKLAQHLPWEKFHHFQTLTLKFFFERPWNLLPSLKKLLPKLNENTLNHYEKEILSAFLTDQVTSEELASIAEAALKNPAFMQKKPGPLLNPPKILVSIINTLKNTRDKQHCSDIKKVNLLMVSEVFLHLFQPASLVEVFQSACSLLSTTIHAYQKFGLKRIIGKIILISPAAKEQMIQKTSTIDQNLTFTDIIFYSVLSQAQLIKVDVLKDNLFRYLSTIKNKPNLLLETLTYSLYDSYLAKALQKYIKEFYNITFLDLILRKKKLQIDKIREALAILFTQAELSDLFVEIFNHSLDKRSLSKLIHLLDKDTLRKLTEKFIKQIQESKHQRPNDLIKLLDILRILPPSDFFSESDFIDVLYKNIHPTNIFLRVSALETLALCFDYVDSSMQTKIVNIFLNHLSRECPLFLTKIIGKLLGKYPHDKQPMLDLLQTKLSEIKNKYLHLSKLQTEESKEHCFRLKGSIYSLQIILADQGVLDKDLDLPFMQTAATIAYDKIKEMYQNLHKFLILMPKDECFVFINTFFTEQFRSIEQLAALCQLVEEDNIKLEDFIQPGNFYHEFLAFYATQYELSIGQEEILTRLAHRKKFQPSEKQALLFAHFDRLWDKSNDLLDNMALLLGEYGFHQSRLTQFFSNRHHISTAEKLATQIHKKQITSLEDLYHQLITIECQNQEGHFFTLREYLYQKMLESNKRPSTSAQPAVFR